MIDPNDIRKRPEEYQQACHDKGIKLEISKFLELDKSFLALKSEVEVKRAEQNKFSKEIGKIPAEERNKKLAEMKVFAEELKVKEDELRLLEAEWNKLMLRVPGIPHRSVPKGKDDSENVPLRNWGEIPEFDFKALDHVELGKKLDILDIERGVKIAGARNYFLKGDGVLLQHAVLGLARDMLVNKGYTLMDPPHIVKYEAMMGTGYFPGGEDQAYKLDERDEGMFLIGTAEVPVCSYFMDEIIEEQELPYRLAGYSPCYRREAGTYGKDAQGIYRIHQFYKIEQVVICKNDEEESAKFHQELLGNAEAVLQKLNLPYQVVAVCTGDMGQGQIYKNDIETWMPSRGKYGETHSCSTFHDFQARRLRIRYKTKEGKNLYCHTLNNTCIASPRVLIPILELNQNSDGSVNIPEALRPYMGGRTRIEPAK